MRVAGDGGGNDADVIFFRLLCTQEIAGLSQTPPTGIGVKIAICLCKRGNKPHLCYWSAIRQFMSTYRLRYFTRSIDEMHFRLVNAGLIWKLIHVILILCSKYIFVATDSSGDALYILPRQSLNLLRAALGLTDFRYLVLKSVNCQNGRWKALKGFDASFA